MKQLKFFVLMGIIVSCQSTEQESVTRIPQAYLGTWVHDQPYINNESEKVTRKRYTLKTSGDSTVLESWYGHVEQTNGRGTAIDKILTLDCRYDKANGYVLCGIDRWTGPDTLRLESSGSLQVTSPSAPTPEVFTRID